MVDPLRLRTVRPLPGLPRPVPPHQGHRTHAQGARQLSPGAAVRWASSRASRWQVHGQGLGQVARDLVARWCAYPRIHLNQSGPAAARHTFVRFGRRSRARSRVRSRVRARWPRRNGRVATSSPLCCARRPGVGNGVARLGPPGQRRPFRPNAGKKLPGAAAFRFSFRPALRFAFRATAHGEPRSSPNREWESRSRSEISLLGGAVSGTTTGKVTGNPEAHDRLGRRSEAPIRPPVIEVNRSSETEVGAGGPPRTAGAVGRRGGRAPRHLAEPRL